MSEPKPIKKPYKLVLIEWVDPQSSCDWIDADSIKEDSNESHAYCKEVGWIVYEDKGVLTICNQISGDGFGNRTTIFKSLIRKRIPLS